VSPRPSETKLRRSREASADLTDFFTFLNEGRVTTFDGLTFDDALLDHGWVRTAALALVEELHGFSVRRERPPKAWAARLTSLRPWRTPEWDAGGKVDDWDYDDPEGNEQNYSYLREFIAIHEHPLINRPSTRRLVSECETIFFMYFVHPWLEGYRRIERCQHCRRWFHQTGRTSQTYCSTTPCRNAARREQTRSAVRRFRSGRRK
jgi:hypothetical protein